MMLMIVNRAVQQLFHAGLIDRGPIEAEQAEVQ